MEPNEGFQIKGPLYDRIKFTVLVVLPALTTFYLTIGSLWDFPEVEKVAGTLSAITLFLGALIGISSRNYKNSDSRFDGTVTVTPNEEGTTLRMNIDPADLIGKTELKLKVGPGNITDEEL